MSAPHNIDATLSGTTEPPAPRAPELRRHLSAPAAPTSAPPGVPLFMLRRAAALVGPDPVEQFEFVRANGDQPDEFWLGAGQLSVAREGSGGGGGGAAGPTDRVAAVVADAAAKWRARASSSSTSLARRAGASSPPPPPLPPGVAGPGDPAGWAEALRREPTFARLAAALAKEEAAAAAAGAAGWVGLLGPGDLAEVNVAACAAAGGLGGGAGADGATVVFRGFRYGVIPGGPGVGPEGPRQSCRTQGPLALAPGWAVVEEDCEGFAAIRDEVGVVGVLACLRCVRARLCV